MRRNDFRREIDLSSHWSEAVKDLRFGQSGNRFRWKPTPRHTSEISGPELRAVPRVRFIKAMVGASPNLRPGEARAQLGTIPCFSRSSVCEQVLGIGQIFQLFSPIKRVDKVL